MRTLVIAGAAALALLAGACTQPPAGQGPPPAPDPSAPHGSPPAAHEPPPPPPLPSQDDHPDPDGPDSGDDRDLAPPPTPVDLTLETATAVADAAAVTDGPILVDEAETVTWPDGSLGCPQPGRTYSQALVEGYRIVLDAAGQTVTYHGAQGQPPERCDDPDDPVG